MKICNKCGTEKKVKHHGGGRLGWRCKRCEREKLRSFKHQMIREVKEKGCTRCGYNSCLSAIHLHHRDSRQKDGLVKDMHTFKQVREELEKCDPVCANCHAELHCAETSHEGPEEGQIL